MNSDMKTTRGKRETDKKVTEETGESYTCKCDSRTLSYDLRIANVNFTYLNIPLELQVRYQNLPVTFMA